MQPEMVFATSKRRHSSTQQRKKSNKVSQPNLNLKAKAKFTKQHHVETARFDFFMLKQTLIDLFDEIKGNKSHVGDLQQDGDPPEGLNNSRLIGKISDAETKLERFEQ